MRTNQNKKQTYPPLKYQIMGAILLLVIPILILLSISNYLTTRQSLLSSYDLLQKQTEANIVNAFTLVDTGYKLFERPVEERVEGAFTTFLEAYDAAGKDPAQIELATLQEELQEEVGLGLDLYVINSEGVIEYTTYATDLGLDFKNVAPDFYETLTAMREGNRAVTGRIAIEIQTGQLRKYSYMPTADHQYLLEIGITSDDFKDLLGELDPIGLAQNLKRLNPTLDQIRIFDEDAQYVLSDEVVTLDEETKQLIHQASTGEQMELINQESGALTRYIFVDLSDERYATNSNRVVELTYNTTLIDEALRTQLIYNLFVSLIAITLTILMSYLISGWISRPILQLNTVAKAIRRGQWQKRVELNRSDEVGQLASSFNDMADEIQKSFEELEQRVAERTAELASAKEKAEVANQAKSAFLANMSHELRTPMNAILGFSQIMRRSQTLTRENQEHLGIISRSGEHLLTLINNVLDLSKIEAGKSTLNVSDFDLYRLLDDLEDMFSLKADQKHLHLIFEHVANLPRYVRTDEVKLRQVLINLINNGLKFTEEGGLSVRVALDATKRALPPTNGTSEQAWLRFEVEDTGQGIAPKELMDLFEAFVQSETGKQAQEGTGLGLPISRKFVQLMGGDMSVKSQVGHGTTFSFEIQVKIVEAGDIRRKQPTRRVIALEPNQMRYRILIVDDKWTNRQLLIKLLNPLGFELHEASNGQEAVERWKAVEPHLIWMDMRMPVMDGYEATTCIKETSKGQATAIIALTASTFEEERAVVLSAGCDDFIRKPFRETEIFDAMHKHIGVRYVYQDSEAAISTTEDAKQHLLSVETLLTLPVGLLSKLEEAMLRLNMQLIDEVMQEIHRHHATLADALTRLTDEFEYDKILALIEKTRSESENEREASQSSSS